MSSELGAGSAVMILPIPGKSVTNNQSKSEYSYLFFGVIQIPTYSYEDSMFVSPTNLGVLDIHISHHLTRVQIKSLNYLFCPTKSRLTYLFQI